MLNSNNRSVNGVAVEQAYLALAKHEVDGFALVHLLDPRQLALRVVDEAEGV